MLDLHADDDELVAGLVRARDITRRFTRAMPVGADERKNAARKQTYRGKQAAKRVGRTHGGVRNRRNRRIV